MLRVGDLIVTLIRIIVSFEQTMVNRLAWEILIVSCTYLIVRRHELIVSFIFNRQSKQNNRQLASDNRHFQTNGGQVTG